MGIIAMKKHITDIVRIAQRGNVEAFSQLVEEFQDDVFSMAWSAVRNFHDAEDIAQEAFILAYKELPRLREPAKFPGWHRRLSVTARSRFLRTSKAPESG